MPVRRSALAVALGAAWFLAASCTDDDTTQAPATSESTAVPNAPAPATPASSLSATTAAATPTTIAPVSTSTAATTTGVTTTPTAPETGPSTTVAPGVVDTGLVLAADGLGRVDFGAPYVEVVSTLSALLGEPDEAPAPPDIPIDQICRDTGEYCPVAIARWRHLRLQFRAQAEDDFRFSGYEFGTDFVGAADGSLGVRPWRPVPWERGLRTSDGITIGTPTKDVAARYPQIWAIICGEAELKRVDTARTDEFGLFGFVVREPRGFYLFPPFKGQLNRVGAMDRPDATLCEGG